MIKDHFFWKLLFVLCFANCKETEPPLKGKATQTQMEHDNFQFLYSLLNGKRLKYIPRDYDKNGTRVFFIDRHNDAWPDKTIDSILTKRKILAVDSAGLKTMTAVIKNVNRHPLTKFLDGANLIDSSDFFIFYIDIRTLTVNKIVTYSDTGDYKLRLANKIYNTYLNGG